MRFLHQYLSPRSVLHASIVFVVISVVYVIFFALQVPEANVLALQTETIPLLPPHEHTVGKDAIGDDGHHVNVRSGEYIAPSDMWVMGVSYELTGAPAFTLHHGTVIQLNARDYECPSEAPRPLASVSQDQAHAPSAFFPEGYGIFIPKGTPLMLDAMFHNPEPPVGPGEIYRDVSLKFNLHLASGPTADLKPLSYHLLRLSNTPCRDLSHTFTVPAHTQEYIFSGTDEDNDASKLRVGIPSRIVYWGAHLHGWEGGESLTVKKNGTPVEVFETTRSTEDTYRFDTPHHGSFIELQEGDTLSIEALYTNPADAPLRGAMGHLGLYLSEE